MGARQIKATHIQPGFPSGSDGKESACCNAGDLGLIPGSRRSPGEGNGYPLIFLPTFTKTQNIQKGKYS